MRLTENISPPRPEVAFRSALLTFVTRGMGEEGVRGLRSVPDGKGRAAGQFGKRSFDGGCGKCRGDDGTGELGSEEAPSATLYL